MSKSRTLSSVLSNPEGPCHTLLERSRFHRNLETRLASLLGVELARHCRVQNLRAGHLMLQTDAPSWAARLRFELPRLLEQLRALPELQQLLDIHVRVVPPEPSRTPLPRRPVRLSRKASALLDATAEGINDPQLRDSLRRLARRSEN